jgi:hypothetical protein
LCLLLRLQPSEIRWASRWDTYLKMTDDQIHWFSIVNSVMIVLFLSGMVAMIMVRTLYRDISKYNQLDTQEDAAEETGWKLVSIPKGYGDGGFGFRGMDSKHATHCCILAAAVQELCLMWCGVYTCSEVPCALLLRTHQLPVAVPAVHTVVCPSLLRVPSLSCAGPW